MYVYMPTFSFARLWAVLRKEWIQVLRDPITLRLILILPMMQLFLFGFAINTDPKNLPTGVLFSSSSNYERSIMAALKNTGYYDLRVMRDELSANEALQRGDIMFLLTVPVDFDRKVDRGERPSILVEADGTDPTAVGNATGALAGLTHVLDRDVVSELRAQDGAAPFSFLVQARYNPERLTALNMVPGLICIVLTISTLLTTTISITREREFGTFENLLAMPLRPLEIIVAKVAPYVWVGYMQIFLILTVSVAVFHVPIEGSLLLLLLGLGVFIASNLALGLVFSVLATTQMQAMQMAQFMLVPSFLISGFLFPFKGMPIWAQWLGDILPITHTLRIVRGVLLKGNGLNEVWPDLWPILIFVAAITLLATRLYRETLD